MKGLAPFMPASRIGCWMPNSLVSGVVMVSVSVAMEDEVQGCGSVYTNEGTTGAGTLTWV